MFSLLKTLFEGAGARAEETVKDRFAIDLLAQHIRDAEAGLAAAKQTLATLILRQRAEKSGLDHLEARVTDLEQRVRSALAANDETLANDGAAAIAELENERAVRRATLRSLGEKADRMRLSIEKAHRRIVDLQQGMIQARAIDAEQKAQRRLNRSIGRTAAISEAEALLARIKDRPDPFEEAGVLDEIENGLSQEAIRARLEEAGHGASTKVRAGDVLARLRDAA